MDEDRKKYLHELMDMTAHHLMRRCAGNLLHFPKGKKFICMIHGHLSIRPDARTNLLLPLASYLLPFKMTSYLLNRNAWRGLLTVHQLQDRSGRTPLDHLFLFLFLLLLIRKPQLLLTNTGERFILLLPDLLVHLLVKLGCHLCTKENKKLKKKKKKNEERVKRKSVLEIGRAHV